jgi:hypothetical protein
VADEVIAGTTPLRARRIERPGRKDRRTSDGGQGSGISRLRRVWSQQGRRRPLRFKGEYGSEERDEGNDDTEDNP